MSLKHLWNVQKKQRRYYSGRKKRHTLKAQLVVDKTSGKIICTAYGIGRIHDFRLLKNTKVKFHDSQLCLADKGYQGIAKLHTYSCIPAKKPRGANFSTPELEVNHEQVTNAA